MKKLMFKGCMLGVVMFGLVVYANYLRTGQLPDIAQLPTQLYHSLAASISDGASSVKRTLSGLSDTATELVGGDAESNTAERPTSSNGIYRWKNADGSVTYGDTPPENARELQAMSHIDPDANLVVLSKPESAPPVAQPPAAPAQAPNPYQIDGVEDIMDEAKKAAQMMEDRQRQQQEILDQL